MKKDQRDVSVSLFLKTRNQDVVLGKLPFLPHEIIFEILSWLPAVSLLRFKCVCKTWFYLIQDRDFIKKHLSLFSISGTMQETFTRIDHVSGIILEKGTVEISVFRCQSTYEFKLVSIYRDKKTSGMQGFKVLTIDVNYKWRPLKLPGSQECRMNLEILQKTHKAIYCDDGTDFCSDVYCLDVGTECFFINTLPQDWDGCLAYADIVEEKLNVIVLEDYRKHRWSQRKIIVPLAFLREIQITDDNFLAPVIFHSNKLYFLLLDDKLFVYDIQLRKITETNPVSWENKSLYTMRHSLVTFKDMQPEKIPPATDF
ncbi:hypothetical protein ACOSQ2_027299 [Xanthoceras sorbifolium]